MRARNCIGIVFAAMPLACALAAPDLPAYAVTDLKALGIWPVAMNANGQVVGNACCGRSSPGVLLYSAGDIRDLGLPAGPYVDCTATAINDQGQIAANAQIPATAGGDAITHAFLHDGNGWLAMDALALGSNAWAVGMNNSGQVIGFAGDTTVGRLAWLYQGGVLEQIGPREPECLPVDISESGEVVGSCPTHAFNYRDGQWLEIGPEYGRAVAVNDAGAIVIQGQHFPGVGNFAYLIEGGFTHAIARIGGVPMVPGSVNPLALNERGDVVGGSSTGMTAASPRGEYHAFAYRGGVTADLGTLDGTSSVAQSVNSTGQIAGTSLDAAGSLRPFVHDDGAMIDVASLRGVGADLPLGDATSLRVVINDGAYLMLTAVDTRTDPATPQAAYLLSPQSPTLSLTASPATTRVRKPVTLSWLAMNANGCVASGGVAGDGWSGSRPTSGEAVLVENSVGVVEYALRCTAGPMATEARVSVTIEKKKSDSGGGSWGLVELLLCSLAARTARKR